MLENQPQIDYHIYKTYQILGLLGKGTYGQVYKVKHKKTHQIFAIKKICDAYQNITDAKRTYRQLNYLFQLAHPCIVKLYQVIPGSRKNPGQVRQSNTSRTDFVKGIYEDHQIGYNTQKTHDGAQQNSTKTSKHVYALFEHVETDLSKALRRCKLQPIQRKYVAYQILHGITYLHKSKLIHRDIKPSNILIDTNCDIKICDFGLCRIKQDKTVNQENQQNIITEYVASRWYRPPEILLGFSPCNEAIDMWGVGCVLAELVLRNPIFQGQSTMDQLEKVFRIIGLPNEQQISKLESDQAKFLLRTFTFSRKNKPQKMSEALCQASDEQLDLIQKLLKFNPNDRLSAEQALKHKYFQEMQKMQYNFSKSNIPVKIIDHTDSSFAFGQIKNFANQGFVDKNPSKKKQISLQHYQNLIEDLERATSRSSNRFCYDQSYKQPDKVIEPNSNFDSERIKQKSTRQSNFLLQHKKLQHKKELQEHMNNYHQVIQTDKILENYNKEKSSTSSHKNLKISEILREGRNAHSTMDNYYSDNGAHPNYEAKNDIILGQGVNKYHFNGKCNNSVEDNLEETYGIFFNPFEKQINKKPVKSIKKTVQNLSTLQDINPKKKLTRKVSSNKSQSKNLIETQKDKSFAKNSSKNLHIQNLDQTKNKYSSHTTLNNINQSNFLSQVKGKIPLYKKPKQLTKDSMKLVKNFSKTKLGSEEKTFKVSSNKNNLKQYENLIPNPAQKTQKERKRSKDFNTNKNNESRQFCKKGAQISAQDHQMNSIQNCFAKIDIKSKQIKPKMEPKHLIEAKKKTVEKKSQHSLKSKSLGKRKSHTKIMSNK